MADDFVLVADLVYWMYDENGDITMRPEPLPLAPYERVVEGVPYLEAKGTYRTIPVVSSEQYPSSKKPANSIFSSDLSTGIKK
jgi:hypothetical protein